MEQINVAKISASALLVNVKISVWTARKLDKKVSIEIDQGKHTKARAGNYHKDLFAGSEKLEAVNKLVSEIRAWHYSMTQPWGDNGDRLLSAALMFDYNTQLADYENRFQDAVNNFLTEYQTLVAAAAFTLGDLFNATDYPALDVVVNKFGLKYEFLPVPMAGDFRVDIGEKGLNTLKDQYEKAISARIEEAMRDAWERMYGVLTRMSERLADNDKGGKQIFRDSLVQNALDLCQMLQHFNITQDNKLNYACEELRKVVTGIDADMLRESDSVRRGVKQRVDGILDKLAI